jgi:hypothetical protein
MPPALLKPAEKVRRVVRLTEAFAELSDLAERFPQVQPVKRQMQGLLDNLIQSIHERPEGETSKNHNTFRSRLIEQHDDVQASAEIQSKIDRLITENRELAIGMVRNFRGTAMKQMEVAFLLREPSEAVKLIQSFSDRRRRERPTTAAKLRRSRTADAPRPNRLAEGLPSLLRERDRDDRAAELHRASDLPRRERRRGES